MLLLRRSISFSFTSMLIWKTSLCLHLKMCENYCLLQLPFYYYFYYPLLSNDKSNHWEWYFLASCGWVEAREPHTIAPLWSLPSTEISTTHLTDGTQPMNHDRPPFKRSAVSFSKHWDRPPSSSLGSPVSLLHFALKVSLIYSSIAFQVFCIFILLQQLGFSSADSFCCRGAIILLEFIYMWSVFTGCG